jgi:hypothetical protein
VLFVRRELDGEDAALARQVVDVDVPAEFPHRLPADGQPETEPGPVLAAPFPERCEEGLGVLLWKTAALIFTPACMAHIVGEGSPDEATRLAARSEDHGDEAPSSPSRSKTRGRRSRSTSLRLRRAASGGLMPWPSSTDASDPTNSRGAALEGKPHTMSGVHEDDWTHGRQRSRPGRGVPPRT